jgi:membrane-bound serine protease (ClpP class)
LDGPEELVTLTAEEATFVGLAADVVPSLEAMGQRLGLATAPTVLEDTWSERLVTFLTSPVVVAVLFFVGLLCVYVEMHTPGFGVAGGVAIFCFAVLFGSRLLVGLAAWWEIALFVAGLVLLGVELFVTPGFGIVGIAGILCCVVALLAMFVPNDPSSLPIPSTNLDWSILGKGVMALSLAFIAAVVAMPLLARVLPKVPLAGRVVLAPPAGGAAPPVSEASPLRTIQPGQQGVVTSTCRPAGIARFGETLVDVVADGTFINPGTTVVVLKNEGNRLIVAPVRSGEPGGDPKR